MQTPISLLQGLAHVERMFEEERCGLLVKHNGHVFPVHIDNIHPEPEHEFSMEMMQVMRVLRSGTQVIGMYHTHRNAKYWPSEADKDGWPFQMAEMQFGNGAVGSFETYVLWVPADRPEEYMIVRYWMDGSTKHVVGRGETSYQEANHDHS